MTTFSKTWQQDINRNSYDTTNTQGPSRSVLFYIKDFLTGHIGGATLGLWTVDHSCDSAVAGTPGDTVDRWGTTYNRTKLVRAAPGVAHSWMVLKSATTPALYLTLDYAGDANNDVLFKMSKAAPTGGTRFDRPSATDEWGWDYLSGKNLAELVTTNHRLNGWLSTDGTQFMIAAGKQGLGVMSFALIFATLADAHTSDQYPYVLACAFYAYGRGGWGESLVGNQSDSTKMRNWDGSVVDSVCFVKPSVAGQYLLYYIPVTGQATDGKTPDWPIWVSNYDGTLTRPLIRGRIEDVFYGSSNTIIPTGEPNDSTPQSVIFGDFWLPGTVVPLV